MPTNNTLCTPCSQGMKEADFKEHVQSLITKKSEKDRNVDRHCERLMQELCSHTYLWNRKELEVVLVLLLILVLVRRRSGSGSSR